MSTISLDSPPTTGDLTGLLRDRDLGRMEGERRPPPPPEELGSSSSRDGLLSLELGVKYTLLRERLQSYPNFTTIKGVNQQDIVQNIAQIQIGKFSTCFGFNCFKMKSSTIRSLRQKALDFKEGGLQ